jgi:hypothetical protein
MCGENYVTREGAMVSVSMQQAAHEHTNQTGVRCAAGITDHKARFWSAPRETCASRSCEGYRFNPDFD